jgi:hypothetical protein
MSFLMCLKPLVLLPWLLTPASNLKTVRPLLMAVLLGLMLSHLHIALLLLLI